MINGACYAEELRQHSQEIVKKQRGKLTQMFCSCKIMHQPRPLVAMAAATKFSFEVLPHPPYSPDEASSRPSKATMQNTTCTVKCRCQSLSSNCSFLLKYS